MTPTTRPAQTKPSCGVNVSQARNGSQRFPSLMLPRIPEARRSGGPGSGCDRLPQIAPHRLGKEIQILVSCPSPEPRGPVYARGMALEAPRNVFDIWFSPFTNFLRNWDYKPVTSWFEHFITINWNSQDADVEQHVLGEVGSYGLQLSRILDAVDLLVKELDLARLTPSSSASWCASKTSATPPTGPSTSSAAAPSKPKRRRPPGRCSRGSSPPANCSGEPPPPA